MLRRISLAGNGGGESGPKTRPPGLDDALAHWVRERKAQIPLEPVELPELFRHASQGYPGLTIGQFHDAVRQLVKEKRLRLYPFTQAMYQLAQPEYALIVGREVMYYVDTLR
jgi:hypothetical protein